MTSFVSEHGGNDREYLPVKDKLDEHNETLAAMTPFFCLSMQPTMFDWQLGILTAAGKWNHLIPASSCSEFHAVVHSYGGVQQSLMSEEYDFHRGALQASVQSPRCFELDANDYNDGECSYHVYGYIGAALQRGCSDVMLDHDAPLRGVMQL